MTIAIVIWVILGIFFVFLVPEYVRHRKRLRSATENVPDTPAMLSRFGVHDVGDGGIAWIPALFCPLGPLKNFEEEACLVRGESDHIIVRRSPDSDELSLPAATFRKIRFFRDVELLYDPKTGRTDEVFSILLRPEELQYFTQIRWHRAVPFFLRWWHDRGR